MARFKLDPNNPPSLTGAERARLDAMTEAEIMAAAITDADNPPLTAEEMARMEAASVVRRVRARTGSVRIALPGDTTSVSAGSAIWSKAEPRLTAHYSPI